MQPKSSSARLFHLLARYTYLQEFLEQQRVLVLGHAESDSADALDRQGVRRAVFIDSSEKRVERARREVRSKRVEFLIGPLDRIALVEDSFDVAIIEDFGGLDDRVRALAAAKRGLTSAGVAVVAIPNPDAAMGLTSGQPANLGYYEFYGQLADSFPFVRMIGQCPLVGFALADLGVDDPEASITFDSSLLEEGSEDAEFFMALCSRSPITSDPFAVVQVPLSWVDLGRLAGDRALPAPTVASVPDEEARADRKPRRQEGDGRQDDEGRQAAKPAAVEPRAADDGKLRKLERKLKQQRESSEKEVKQLKLEIDRRAVTIAKLENHLREARERAATEHNRVIESKLALESERKKLLSLEKEVEMGRRVKKMAPAPRLEAPSAEDPTDEVAAPPRQEQDAALQQEITSLRKSTEEKSRALASAETRVADSEKEIAILRKELAEAREEQKKAEVSARDAEHRASRADGLAADLGRERGARRLAEKHADELQRQLKELKQSQATSAGPRITPQAAALKKAEAIFGGGTTAAELEATKAQLSEEQEARQRAEARLDELQSGDVAEKLRSDLDAERAAHKAAVDKASELESQLSKIQAKVARLETESAARRRVERAFGGAEDVTVSEAHAAAESDSLRTELSACIAEKSELGAQVTREREMRRGAEARADELEGLLRDARYKAEEAERVAREARERVGGAEEEARESLANLEALEKERREALARNIELQEELEKLRLEQQQLSAPQRATIPDTTDDQPVAPESTTLARPDTQPDLEIATGETEDAVEALEEPTASVSSDEIARLEELHTREISDLEAALKRRSARVKELEDELGRQASLLKQALDDLEVSASRDTTDPAAAQRATARADDLEGQLVAAQQEGAMLEHRLKERERDMAELTGELQGQKWRIAELEMRTQTGGGPTGVADQPPRDGDDAPMLSLGKAKPRRSRGERTDSIDSSVERELARAQGRAEVLEREHERFRAEIEGLRSELLKAQATIAKFEATTAASEPLMERYEKMQTAVDQANTRAAAMERKAAETVGQLTVLERELASCHQARQAMKEELGEARQSLGALTAHRREVEQRCARLESELEGMRLDAAESSRDLAAAQACVAMLEEQMPGVSAMLDEIRADQTAEYPILRESESTAIGRPTLVDSLQPPVADPHTLEARLAQTKTDLEKAKTREAVLQARLDEVGELADQRASEIVTMNARLTELERELAATRERSAQIMGELAQAQASASLSQGELDDVQEQADSASLERVQLEAELEQATAHVERAEAKILEQSIRIQEITGQLEREQAAIAELRAEAEQGLVTSTELRKTTELRSDEPVKQGDDESTLSGLQELLSSARHLVAEHEGRALGYESRIRELEGELGQAQRALLRADEAGKTAIEEHRDASAESADEGSQAQASTDEVARLEKAEAEARLRCDELDRELTECRRRVEELEFVNERVDDWSEQMEAAETRSQQLRDELEELREKLKSGETIRTELDATREKLAEVEKLRAELEEARESLGRAEGLESELEQLRAELASAAPTERDEGDSDVSVDADGLSEEDCPEIRALLAEEQKQVASLEEERRAAEEALERVIEGFSEVRGDADALIELLKHREDLIARLQGHLNAAKEACVEMETESEDVESSSDDDEFAEVEAVDGDIHYVCRRKLESARRVVKSLEADKKHLAEALDQVKAQLEQLRS